MGTYETGVRKIVDDHLIQLSKERRDYGDYWSASSAGYCMRKVIFDRLQVPQVKEDARKQRIFTSGHIFHDWIQELTRNSGVSICQEVELIDNDLMIKGHFDDLVEVEGRLVLYDYKTQNSRAFSYKRPEMSHYHKMQLGTYMYMLRKGKAIQVNDSTGSTLYWLANLKEARILKISKDDLRMSEEQLFWSEDLEHKVTSFWKTLNSYWKSRQLPSCTCADQCGGFMANEKYNPYFYNGEPCSTDWYNRCKQEGLIHA
jgi:hypothetical protein